MRGAALLLIMAVPATMWADEVILKGGGRLRGSVLESSPDKVVVDVGAGLITVPRSRVERVIGGPSAVAEYRARAAKLDGSVEGWLELARWAQDAELSTQAAEAFEHVLALSPGNSEAHAALGHQLVNGRWLPGDEAWRARGYVRFEGRWVTPEEHAALLAEKTAAAAADGRDAESRARVLEAEARAREAEARAAAAEADARRADTDPSAGGLPFPIYGGGAIVRGYRHDGTTRPRAHHHEPPSPAPPPVPPAPVVRPHHDAPPPSPAPAKSAPGLRVSES